MIEIKITRKVRESYQTVENFETTKEPTEITEDESSSYSSYRKKVTYRTTSEPREVTRYREIEQTVLLQHLEGDVVNKYWLNAVIQAVNSMNGPAAPPTKAE